MAAVQTVEREFVTYYPARSVLRAHVDAVHAKSPGADTHTGEIARQVAARTGCACVVARVSRREVDLNRVPSPADPLSVEAMREYRDTVRDILRSCGNLEAGTGRAAAPHLHLAVHGMDDRYYGPHAVEVGTRYGLACSAAVSSWLLRKFRYLAAGWLPPGTEVVLDRRFPGDRAALLHREDDTLLGRGFGPNYHFVQLEISRTLREEYRDGLVEVLSAVVKDFGKAFGS